MNGMRRLLLPLVLALVLAPTAGAAGGRYVFDGGTHAEQGQVASALNASSFDWSIVPGRVVVHIRPNVGAAASPGEIWLDSSLLDSGRFSWGVVLHEYAHLVDFGVLTDAQRARLAAVLGGSAGWFGAVADHSQLGSERFADLLAWSYWQSADNVMRPAGSVSAGTFRGLLASVLGSRALASAQPARQKG